MDNCLLKVMYDMNKKILFVNKTEFKTKILKRKKVKLEGAVQFTITSKFLDIKKYNLDGSITLDFTYTADAKEETKYFDIYLDNLINEYCCNIIIEIDKSDNLENFTFKN
jgi:hypothetical protein